VTFEPIAVVGEGCVLPDALDPTALWANIAAGRVSLSSVPDDRWKAPRHQVLGTAEDPVDHTWTDQGGYVRGFDAVFDPGGMLIDAEQITGLDPVFQWVLYGVRQALSGVRSGAVTEPDPHAGLVLGNLSYPTAGMGRYADGVWRAEPTLPDPRNRFSSGLPAHLAAQALGLGACAFALDAACASSLYAIKLACDRLHDRRADLMVAGAVNCADDLHIHLGFCALSAMSRTGRCRPFQDGADGLVPAEGAAFVALMRLDDATAQQCEILGIIRGIGLSNDGSAGGLLAPDEEGQRRAMRAAYAAAGVDPATVSLLECHATGTTVGDAVEIRSTSDLFADGVAIGSVKGNLGHPITAAGAAGLLKVLGALRHGIRPMTVGVDRPNQALRGTGLRLLLANEHWSGPRRAAVSSFGFGGNNAHLIVDAPDTDVAVAPWPGMATPHPDESVAVVALSARVGDGADGTELAGVMLAGRSSKQPLREVRVNLAGLRFPPHDLNSALPQQLLMLETGREAAGQTALDRERTMVLIGMGCDPEIARYLSRWRASADERDCFTAPLTSAGVLGAMPNVVANRLNAQLDVVGPGFTVSAEEASGLVALELAARALRAGEVDAALVGAVDLSHEPVHQSALAGVGRARPTGDAAVALVLKRLSDARRDNDQVLAVLDDAADPDLVVGSGGFDPADLVGSAHAAAGLVSIAAAVLALRHRARPAADRPAMPAFGVQTAEVRVSPLEGPTARIGLRASDVAGWLPQRAPQLRVFSGRDRSAVLEALDAGRESDAGPARLVLAVPPEQFADRVAAARRWLLDGGRCPDGIAFRDRPLDGEVAFVYTNGSAAYPGMASELFLAFPEIAAELQRRCGALEDVVGWAYRGQGGTLGRVLGQIWGAALVGQLHTEITRERLGIAPSAVLGYSSGEATGLVAMRAWRDVRAVVRDVNGSQAMTDGIVGSLRAVRRTWAEAGIAGERWASYLVSGPLDHVQTMLESQPAVHLMAVNAPGICVVGGEETACERVLGQLTEHHPIRLAYDIAVHAPEVLQVRDEWWGMHHHETQPVPGVRFYTGASGDWYVPNADSAADAITAQAVGTIHFDRMVERAWADGVRVFIEHGPRGMCTTWIQRTLGDREYLAVALDDKDGGIRQLTRVVTELVAAGVTIDAVRVFTHFETLAPAMSHGAATIGFPAHPAPVVLPAAPVEQPAELMSPAPWLPIGDESGEPGAAVTPEPAVLSPRAAQALMATRAHQRMLTSALDDFLQLNSHVHQAFLASRQRAVALLAKPVSSTSAAAVNSTSAAAVNSTSAAAVAPAVTVPEALPGPKFDRAQLEHHATGRISDLFGPQFVPQDGYQRQTRMPAPPMLLADRVTGIEAVAASMGSGTIWTETDVRADSWYLDPAGRMPAGLLVEAGQANLLLLSWLGADLVAGGDRVYRLLGCEFTFHGSLPTVGETLRFAITIDDHSEHNGMLIFFFHFDCYIDKELRLSVRGGQAGLFTDVELQGTAGVLWDPPFDPPTRTDKTLKYTTAQVCAFAEGRIEDCFGSDWRGTRSHVRTPRTGCGRPLLIGRVACLDTDNGYLRAETEIRPDSWFFEGHFHYDPVFAGTLILEGCLQAMAFYLTALGVTVNRDGWRFEPVSEHPVRAVCRGQATPDSRLLTYEVFVSGVTLDGTPTLCADVLCMVDGVKSFLARDLSVRLVRDWPLASLVQQTTQRDPRAAVVDGFRYDYQALLAAALGRPSDAFGVYGLAQNDRRLPRLPNPPYHFITRIAAVEGRSGAVEVGSAVVAEYDVPDRGWYFEQNDHPCMPLAVLLEVVLQPCGWLASFAGCALVGSTDLLFRNLDGTMTVLSEVGPQDGVISTRAVLRQLSQDGNTVIVSFDLECSVDGRDVLNATTVFGCFPPEAFLDRVGLPTTDEQRALLAAPCRLSAAAVSAPGPMLQLLDTVTRYWPDGGRAGLGRLVAEKDVDPGDWFFRAHFFGDPVQPGSLGLEAMQQLLRYYLVHSGATRSMRRPNFEPVMLGSAMTWKYRGQVTPADKRVTIEMEIVAAGQDNGGQYAVAEAWLWVDGTRIYHSEQLGIRVRECG
jgi:acyl transferase domain-containing protein/3-hydroxymyristoyl/3-hydroxydecanoyl-(acyl carrier protein) dehydratase